MLDRTGVSLALATLLASASAQAQWTDQLPPVIPPESQFSAQPPAYSLGELPGTMRASPAAFYDPNIDQTVPGPLAAEPPTAVPAISDLPPGAKQGVLQEVAFTNTWLSGSEPDDLEIFDSELRVSLGMPFPTVRTPLVITPGVGMHLFDGPDAPDLPSRVYDAYLDILWKNMLDPNFTFDIALTPGWYSDFEQNSDEALRIGGRVLARYQWTPITKFMLGLAYLDRDDVDVIGIEGVLPIIGVVLTPNDDLRLELVIPKPRVAWRTSVDGCHEQWWYVRGEFGGGTWAIERQSGLPDVVNYSDLRISLGHELKYNGDPIAWLELGYVFDREISYDSGSTPDFSPNNTIMLRAGLGY